MNLPLPRDEAALDVLVQRLVQRDESALTALYRQTAGRVYAAALRITRDRALAEEAVEATYWKAWCEPARFDPARGEVMAWLQTLVRSRALDALRSSKRRHALHPSDDAMDSVACPRPRPDEALARQQHLALIDESVGALAPLPRQLLTLAFARGLTHEEIASHAGLPAGTVKSQIRRALALLRQRLQRRGLDSAG